MTNEKHPLEPFLPHNAKLLMLGSFPPPQTRWSMDFFYPNFQNDMWRIMGEIFYEDKLYFVNQDEKCFDKEKVVTFCTQKGIALYDTASVVIRLKENASDKFLEIVQSTDVRALLAQMPHCHAIATTGQKATDTLVEMFNCAEPTMGTYVETEFGRLYRQPSSSRAYPLSLAKKAASYRAMLQELKILK